MIVRHYGCVDYHRVREVLSRIEEGYCTFAYGLPAMVRWEIRQSGMMSAVLVRSFSQLMLRICSGGESE